MIVLDTSIISTFALIGAVDLLYALFPNDDLVWNLQRLAATHSPICNTPARCTSHYVSTRS